MCYRCQAAPEGGAGKSLFNLRAWGANLVNNLLLGQEQKQRSEQQLSGNEAQQAEPRPSENGAASKPAELRILPVNAEEEAWELWKEVCHAGFTTSFMRFSKTQLCISILLYKPFLFCAHGD